MVFPPNDPFNPNDNSDDAAPDALWSDAPIQASPSSSAPSPSPYASDPDGPSHEPFERTQVFKPVEIIAPVPGYEATQIMESVAPLDPTQAIPIVQPRSGIAGRNIVIGVVGVLAAVGLGFLASTFFGASDGSTDDVLVDSQPDPTDQSDAVLVLTCPDGSTGSPTAESPTCTQTTTTNVAPIPGQTFTCPDGASGSPTSEDPTCAAGDSGTIAALKATVYACPANSTGTPTVSDPFCSATVTSPVGAVKTTTYACPDGTNGSPTSDDPTCAAEETEEQIDANEAISYACPEGATGSPTADEPTCTATTTSTSPAVCASGQDETSDGRCVAADATPRTLEDDESCTADEVERDRDDGEPLCFPVVAPSVCESGTLNGVACEETIEEAVEADRVVTYSCQEGTTGAPTDAEPFCTVRGSATVPADIEIDYSCPDNASGSPTESDPVCEQTTTSAVGSVATIDFSCPAGSSGTPTAANQTCTKDGSDTVPAIETSSFECPDGASGEPTDASSTCTITINETVAAVAAE